MRTQRAGDFTSGLVLAGFGLIIIIAGLQIEAAFAERLPPQTLPVALGGVLAFFGLMLSLRSWRYRGPEVLIEWPNKEGWIRVILSYAGFCLYLILINPIGFPLATLLYLAFHIWYLDRKPLRAIIIAAITAAIVLFVFIRVLELTFPVGPLTW